MEVKGRHPHLGRLPEYTVVSPMASKFVEEYRLPATEELLGRSVIDDEENASFPVPSETTVRPSSAAVKSAENGWAVLAAHSRASSSPEVRSHLRSAPRVAERQATDWHEIPEATMTPELRRDLVLLENRAHLDPKRFYKSSGTGRKRGELPTRVHVGTVVEAAHEYLSGRLTNRERRKSFADEVFSDGRLMENAKRRFTKVQHSRHGKKRVVDPASRGIRKKRQMRRGGGGGDDGGLDDW